MTSNKLNLLLRAQELGIDAHILLRPISYSWKWLRSVYLFQNFWSWYELVKAEKSLMTRMELIKCTCSFYVFNWQHITARIDPVWFMVRPAQKGCVGYDRGQDLPLNCNYLGKAEFSSLWYCWLGSLWRLTVLCRDTKVLWACHDQQILLLAIYLAIWKWKTNKQTPFRSKVTN